MNIGSWFGNLTLPAFLADLWPNLAATTLGIVIGVPFALWVNRRMLEHERREGVRNDREQLGHAIACILDEVETNAGAFETLASDIEQKKLMFELGINSCSWEANREELIRLLRDADLRTTIAGYYFGVGLAMRLNSTLFDTSVGASLNSSPELLKALRVPLVGHLKRLKEIGDKLHPRLAGVKEQLSSPA